MVKLHVCSHTASGKSGIQTQTVWNQSAHYLPQQYYAAFLRLPLNNKPEWPN